MVKGTTGLPSFSDMVCPAWLGLQWLAVLGGRVCWVFCCEPEIKTHRRANSWSKPRMQDSHSLRLVPPPHDLA